MIRLTILSLLLMVNHINANHPFEGSITYRIDINDENNTNHNDFPTEITSHHKDGKMRIDIPIDEVTFSIISNTNTDEVAFLMNAEGLKFALKTNKSNLSKEIQDEVSGTHITHTNYHKNIIGLKCHKTIIHNNNEESIAYITKQINAEGFAWLFNQQLNGILMEFKKTDHKDGDEIHIYATKVDAGPISNHYFTLPDDHIMISISDLDGLLNNELFN